MRIMQTIGPLLLVLALAAPAWGSGAGYFLSMGSGTSDLTVEGAAKIRYAYDLERIGGGLMIDTAVRDEDRVNYRLSIGYEQVSYDAPGLPGYDFTGAYLAYDIGYAVLMSEWVRLWVGPEIRAMYYTGTSSLDRDARIELSGGGVGAVAGLNVALSPETALVATGGYIWPWLDDSGSVDSGGMSYHHGLSEEFGFVQFGVMFAIPDPYSSGRTRTDWDRVDGVIPAL